MQCNKNEVLSGENMKIFCITIVSLLLSSSSLCQFFMDYKKEKYFIASIELVTAIMWMICCACTMWHCTLQTIT